VTTVHGPIARAALLLAGLAVRFFQDPGVLFGSELPELYR
jgi:hypothetical protein